MLAKVGLLLKITLTNLNQVLLLNGEEKMSKVISIDLEMNQPSNKIIQLGYVIGDCVTEKILTHQSIIINPNEELGLIPGMEVEGIPVHITEYTGITQEMVDSGLTLEQAYELMCNDIKKYNPTRTVVQWGDGKGDNKGDHDCLRTQLGLSWNDFILRPRAWDVKSQFQIYRIFNREGVVAGLSKALEILNMEFEGRPHNAMWDAHNTFRCFCALGIKASNYDKIKKIVK